MKYTSIKSKSEKTLILNDFSGGINTAGYTTKSNELSVGENVYFKDGILLQRPGIFSAKDYLLTNPDRSDFDDEDFFLSDVLIFINGEEKRLVYTKNAFSLDKSTCYIYLVGNDLIPQYIGNITSSRVDDEHFYVIKNIVFYKGEKISGGGIFALVYLENEHNSAENELQIYEINSDFSAWNFAITRYIPTTLINGHGNKYSQALSSGSVLNTKERILEAPNLLESAFYSYFTSDGYSYAFNLPYTNLSDAGVIFRYYIGLSDYVEWSIYPNENEAVATLDGEEVKMHLNRETGTVYFKLGDKEYPLPENNILGENNIRIIAHKDWQEEILPLGDSILYDTRTVFSMGNKLYYIAQENPLYIPVLSENSVGEEENITSLLRTKDKILLLKPSEAYLVSYKKGNQIGNIILARKEGDFKENDEFTSICLNKKIGCLNKNCLISCASKPVFFASDSNIYAFLESSKKFENLSLKVSQIKDFSLFDFSLKASSWQEGYLLSNNNEILFFDLKEEAPKCYLWKIPEGYSLIKTFELGAKCILAIKNLASGYIFLAEFLGTKDNLLKDEEGSNSEIYDIMSTIKTNELQIGGLLSKKRLNSIILSFKDFHKADIEILSGKNSRKFKVYKSDKYDEAKKLILDMYCDNKITLKMSLSEPFYLSEIIINYI